MTDIFDFRGEAFKTYLTEWSVIFKTIFKATEISGKMHEGEKYHTFFKRNKPGLWMNGCSSKTICNFIVRARMIVSYVLIDLNGNLFDINGNRKWVPYKSSATGEWSMINTEEYVVDEVLTDEGATDEEHETAPCGIKIEEVN